MSLYGNVKKIGAAAFQFDRVYHSRTEMDLAAAKDGVYAGRYVLVEYGERFENLPITQEVHNALDYLSHHQNSMTSENWTEFFQNYKHIGLADPQLQADFMIAPYSTQENYLTQLLQDLNNRLETVTSDLPASVIEYLGQPNIYLKIDPDTGAKTQVIERDEFLNSEKLDLQNYGAIYDSTVWQKIYIQNQDRYVMVAELNAMAPKLDVEEKAPLTYTPNQPAEGESTTTTQIPDDEQIVAGKKDEYGNFEIVKLTNAIETYNKSYFDTTVDTELRYLLHQPRVIQVEAGNNTVDFHKNGFNMAYSYGEKEGPSTISLIPKGLTDYEIVKDELTGEPIKDANQIPLATLNKKTDVDGKLLYMNMPSFGNAMNTIYDLLYGFPDATEEEYKHGVLRPYFRQFLRDFKFTVYATVRDAITQELYYITIDGEKIPITDTLERQDQNGEWHVSTTIPTYNYDSLHNKDIQPDHLIAARYYDSTQKPIVLKELPNEQPADETNLVYVLANIQGGTDNLTEDNIYKFTMHVPTGDDDPNYSWAVAPELKKLVQINATGLAGILSNLFGDRDPITGTTRYYLYNDWTATSNGKTNIPTILNKPYTIGGYLETFATRKEDLYLLDGRDTTQNPAKRSGGATINQHYYTDTIISKEFTGGHYEMDFDTWQLKSKADAEEVSMITS